jgi:putative endonuclease
MAVPQHRGQQGEQLAVQYLTSKGYVVLQTNWRSGRAEVDVICRHNRTIVFVEVKTRTGNFAGFPEESVSIAKQRLLARAAGNYLYANALDAEIRFDIVSVTLGQQVAIDHFEDAFFPIDQ